jgi:hypothetical protein
MAHWRSNTSCSVVKSRFKWRYLRKGNNGKHNRKYVRFMVKMKPCNILQEFVSDWQNPPSGPPLITLGD